jgi:quercetin dioxygenase-like cupin family protein
VREFEKLIAYLSGEGIVKQSPQAAPSAAAEKKVPVYWVVGNTIRFVGTRETTGGAYALFDVTTAPGLGAPPHVHGREDEAFWVLEGEIALQVGETTVRLGPGQFAHAPRGVKHGYSVTSAKPARYLVMSVPGGLEDFFAEAGRPVTPDSPPPEVPTEEDIRRIVEVAPKYGLQMLAP